jgi:hydrogenase nickel incorporation protein HypA/HybF
MHELPVTESILEIALRHAEVANAARVTDIYLVIGQLASIVDDSVQFYWDMISAETIAAGARLHFKRIPAELLCLDCQERYHPGEGELACPRCGGRHVKVVSGEEFRMEAIEVESAEDVRARDERSEG